MTRGILHIILDLILPPFKEKIAEKVTANILNAMTIVNAKDQDQFGIIVLDQDIEKIYNSVG